MSRRKLRALLLPNAVRISERGKVKSAAKRGSSNSKSSTRSEFLDYPENWNEISLYVRKRDGWRCQYRKIDPSSPPCYAFFPPPFHGQLHAHHLDSGPNRSHRPQDIITLCHRHHAKVHKR